MLIVLGIVVAILAVFASAMALSGSKGDRGRYVDPSYGYGYPGYGPMGSMYGPR